MVGVELFTSGCGFPHDEIIGLDYSTGSVCSEAGFLFSLFLLFAEENAEMMTTVK